MLRSRSFLVVFAAAALACGAGTPDSTSAESALKARLGGPLVDRLRMSSFEKTDGQSGEMFGVAVYSLEFKARVDVLGEISYTDSDGQLMAREPRPHANGIWVGPVSKSAWPGDALYLDGRVEYERKESGWVARSVRFNTAYGRRGAPARVPEPYRSTLTSWLVAERQFRIAELADCRCDDDLPAIRAAYDNDDPYFVVADLNGDSVEDIAVVVYDRTKRPTAPDGSPSEDINQFWNMGLVVFNGPVDGRQPPAFVDAQIGAAQGALLFYSASDKSLLVGKWESSARILVPAGRSYTLQ